MDRWHSLQDFEGFQTELRDQYQALDAKLEGVAGEEVFLGAFDETD